MSGRNAVEESRERLIALVLLLQTATKQSPLTQETIVRELYVDDFPVSSKGPRKVRAYQGNDGAVRQKFERDKSRIRELGFEIETLAHDDGSVGYWIDAESSNAPLIDFTDDEARVVQLALRFYGFGAVGAFSLFNTGAGTDGGLEFTNYYTPVLRALHLRRVLTFDYQSSTNKSRRVDPLLVGLFHGVAYLIARVHGTDDVKGYRFTRMTSMPVVLPDQFDAPATLRELGESWRPEFAKTPSPIDVVVTTNENYAELLVRQFPRALVARKKGGRREVGLTFENRRAALRFIVEAAERVRLVSPTSLKVELAKWLPQVNRGSVPNLSKVTFAGPPTNDVLGQTLQLLHAVHLADDGLRISDIAQRFSLEPSLVRRLLDRLVTFEPMGGDYGFPARVVKECDDWDNEAVDDSLYRAEFFGRDGVHELSPLMWRDLFELNIALREASRVYRDPALLSAIDKIESAAEGFVHVESVRNETLLEAVAAAIEKKEQIKIQYTPGLAQEAQLRSIEPREMKVLNGHTYLRAYCTTREGWRTFRIDRIGAIVAQSPADDSRPPDPAANWLTQVGEVGDEVVVVVDAQLRWLFEPLPNAQWSPLRDGRHAVKFRCANQDFLDNLMVRAGAGAVVATPHFAQAGHDLAKRIANQL